MTAMGPWLFGMDAYLTETIVWSDGSLASLAVAGLLLLSVAALVLMRERAKPVVAPAPKRRRLASHDHCLPSAA